MLPISPLAPPVAVCELCGDFENRACSCDSPQPANPPIIAIAAITLTIPRHCLIAITFSSK